MSRPDNPQAFPNQGYDHGPGNCRGYPSEGMTLRDYFAAKAMQSNISSVRDHMERAAANAYAMADAMLTAREK